MDERIARIRNFNRAITRRLGVLDSSFLGCGVSLGKARLLFEISRGTIHVQQLRAKLGLDSGQMSRMLRSLEQQRLVETSVDPKDGRARLLKLTRAGKAKLGQLERRADEGARSWLSPLSPGLQARLQAAMADVERLLAASEIEIRLEDPRSEAAVWCFGQFFRELNVRFDAGFDPGRSSSAGPEELTPPAGYLLLATSPERAVGCAALKLGGTRGIGEVKRMWVSEAVRGLGIGRRLLEAIEDQARRAGVRRLRLSTNRSLTEAQALYRAAGYREIPLFDDDEPYAHLAFEKRLA